MTAPWSIQAVLQAGTHLSISGPASGPCVALFESLGASLILPSVPACSDSDGSRSSPSLSGCEVGTPKGGWRERGRSDDRGGTVAQVRERKPVVTSSTRLDGLGLMCCMVARSEEERGVWRSSGLVGWEGGLVVGRSTGDWSDRVRRTKKTCLLSVCWRLCPKHSESDDPRRADVSEGEAVVRVRRKARALRGDGRRV